MKITRLVKDTHVTGVKETNFPNTKEEKPLANQRGTYSAG